VVFDDASRVLLGGFTGVLCGDGIKRLLIQQVLCGGGPRWHKYDDDCGNSEDESFHRREGYSEVSALSTHRKSGTWKSGTSPIVGMTILHVLELGAAHPV
jgi:hypothetical protein